MAITRAQQVKQMLREGGRIGFKRGNPKDFGFNPAQAAANVGKASTAPPGRQDPRNFGFDAREAQKSKQYSSVTPTDKDGRIIEQYEGTTEMGDVGVVPVPDKKTQKKLKKTLRDKNPNPFLDFLNPLKRLYNITPNDPGTELRFLSRLTPEQASKLSPALQAKYQELIAAEDADAFGDPSTLEDLYNTKFTFTEFDDLKNFGDNNFAKYAGEQEGKFGLLLGGNVGNIEVFKKADGTYGYREKTGGDNAPVQIANKIITDPTDPTDPNQTTGIFSGVAPRFAGSKFDFDALRRLLAEEQSAADGGRIGAAEGGIMDLETGRQMYFLGKLVKKATRAVKKIAKSPIGKAAILGGAMYFGGAGGAGGGLKSFFGKGSFNPFLMSPDKGASFGFSGLGKILNKAGLVNLSGGLTLGGKFGLGTLALPFLMGDKQDEEDLDRGPELTMEELRAIRNSPYRYMAPRFEGSKYKFAEGGEAKEPVAKKTMPLLDMGGKEMDLRDDGGFVPIGRMEKADDVPARLSKNEFVFTADAVRNAGEGDVDKGAEVMYNMMKNLESGGEVSEESQGLQGARDMFQTSKRLEEVL